MAASRASRKFLINDEAGVRRARGEIACAECRRLKLKCDKNLPCSSCVRRGCSSICPKGSLVTADAEQSHSKISEMGHRICQLEGAIKTLQSAVSDKPHPLLRDKPIMKFDHEKKCLAEEKRTIEESPTDLIDAIGTLTVSDQQEPKYFGRSAGSEMLLLVGAELEAGSVDPQIDPGIQLPRIFYSDTEGPPALTSDLTKMSSTFPFGVSDNIKRDIDLLLSYLPHRARAWSLCEVYMEQGGWGFRPIPRDEMVDDILTPVYKALKERNAANAILQPSVISVHKLAVLFLIFAIGSLMDLTLEPFNAEADRYYHLSRACLSLQNIFDSLEVATVQAILLMAPYHTLRGRKYTLDNTWSLLSFASKLAQSLGLHRDVSRWNMDIKSVERRQNLFWEICSMDLVYSLALGRPPSIRLSYIDCQFPKDCEATLDANGNILVGFYRWKYEFMKEAVANAVELTLGAEPPSYKTILDLDQKVRGKTLPPHLNVFISPGDERFTPYAYMQGCTLGLLRAQALLLLHKGFFAQAMLDFPDNPLRSPYAPSFLASYRCASSTINTCLNFFDRFPDKCCRWWWFWTFLFTAAVIVGSIVTRSPCSSIASSAFVELGAVCDLYENAAVLPPRARSARAILQKLWERARKAYSLSGHVPEAAELLTPGNLDCGGDELALFGGQTRVLVLRLLSARSKQPSSTPSPSSQPDYKDPEVHPSLFEYLSNFAPQYANLEATIDLNTQISIPQANVMGSLGSYMSPASEQAYQAEIWLQSGQTYDQLEQKTDPEIVSYQGGTMDSGVPPSTNIDFLENAGQTAPNTIPGGGSNMDPQMSFLRSLGLDTT